MNTFIVGLLAFLVMLFPGCQYLQMQYQASTFEQVAIQGSIKNAIKAKDILALEAMMCKQIKQTAPNLSDEIGGLLNVIDGTIVEFDDGIGDTSRDLAGSGKRSMRGWHYCFKTATKSYRLDVTWIIIDTRDPETMGLAAILLRDEELLQDFVSGITDDPELCVLARIQADLRSW
jgi:hypothetical protein